MRSRQVIEREMYAAREDLEISLAELKHAVREKVDVRARARVAVAKGKQRAHDVLERGKTASLELAGRAKQRPDVVAAIAGGVIAIGVLVYVGRRRAWW